MMRGEFESLGAIYSAVPGFCPKPVCWGAFRAAPGSFFSLSTCHERVAPPADPAAFCARLARLHTKSVPSSATASGAAALATTLAGTTASSAAAAAAATASAATAAGSFGFPVRTFFGDVLTEKVACATWEECFAALLRHMLQLDEDVNGADDTLVQLREELLARVVPRLLRPLESGGRRLRPALCHGDLRAANAGSAECGAVMVFRPAALYAHNEFELGPWRALCHGFDRRFLRAYLRLVPPSEPRADFDDRNALYALRHLAACSIRYPGSAKYRHEIVAEMARLVDRFAPKPERAWYDADARFRDDLLADDGPTEDPDGDGDGDGVAVPAAAGPGDTPHGVGGGASARGRPRRLVKSAR